MLPVATRSYQEYSLSLKNRIGNYVRNARWGHLSKLIQYPQHVALMNRYVICEQVSYLATHSLIRANMYTVCRSLASAQNHCHLMPSVNH